MSVCGWKVEELLDKRKGKGSEDGERRGGESKRADGWMKEKEVEEEM